MNHFLSVHCSRRSCRTPKRRPRRPPRTSRPRTLPSTVFHGVRAVLIYLRSQLAFPLSTLALSPSRALLARTPSPRRCPPVRAPLPAPELRRRRVGRGQAHILHGDGPGWPPLQPREASGSRHTLSTVWSTTGLCPDAREEGSGRRMVELTCGTPTCQVHVSLTCWWFNR